MTSEPTTLTNKTMCVKLYLTSKTQRTPTQKIIFGISCVDVLNGDTYFCEYTEDYRSFNKSSSIYDNLERICCIHQPREIVFLFNGKYMEHTNIDTISQFIGCNKSDITIRSYDYIDKEHEFSKMFKQSESQSFHMELFKNCFKHLDMNCLYDSCNMREWSIGTESLCFLILFLSQYNDGLLTKMKPPTLEYSQDTLHLGTHSLRQLNIIDTQQSSAGKLSSVSSFLNCCRTYPGKRLFNHQLLHPSTNIEWINNEYNTTETLFNDTNEIVNDVLNVLNNCNDSERLLRRAKMNKCNIDELMKINDDVNNTLMIMNIISKNDALCQYIENKTEMTREDIQYEFNEFNNFFKGYIENSLVQQHKNDNVVIISNKVILPN